MIRPDSVDRYLHAEGLPRRLQDQAQSAFIGNHFLCYYIILHFSGGICCRYFYCWIREKRWNRIRHREVEALKI